MNLQIELQNPANYTKAPAVDLLQRWGNAAILQPPAACVIRIVDEEEGQYLNYTYRGKNYPTNVLSFPNELPDFDEALQAELADDYLGDVIVCASVVEREAVEQQKDILHHWAHMIVHSLLHLQGYDHVEDSDATEMEALEVNILENLGFPNPYQPLIKET